jgi:hypothetical protein
MIEKLKEIVNSGIKSYKLEEGFETEFDEEDNTPGLIGLYNSYKNTKNIKELNNLLNGIQNFLENTLRVFMKQDKYKKLREKISDKSRKAKGVTFKDIEDAYKEVMADEDFIENLKYFRFFQKKINKENDVGFQRYFTEELIKDKLKRDIYISYFTAFFNIITDINIIIDIYNKELKNMGNQELLRLGGSSSQHSAFQKLIKDILRDF